MPLAYSDPIRLLADPQIFQRPVHLPAPLLGILDLPDALSATSIKPSLFTHSEMWPPSLFSLFTFFVLTICTIILGCFLSEIRTQNSHLLIELLRGCHFVIPSPPCFMSLV